MKDSLRQSLGYFSISRPIRLVGLLLLGLWFVSMGGAQVTIGDALIDRSFHDGSSGGVYIYTGTFGQAGVASTWAFDTRNTGNHYLAPLLFQKLDASNYELKGVGEWAFSNKAETRTGLAFNLIAGSATVGADYTFGFTDRKVSYSGSGSTITTEGHYTGMIEAEADGLWAFTYGADATAPLILGQVFQIGAAIGGDASVVALYGAGYRTYSAQMTTTSIPEPAAFTLWIGMMSFVFILGCRRRKVFFSP